MKYRERSAGREKMDDIPWKKRKKDEIWRIVEEFEERVKERGSEKKGENREKSHQKKVKRKGAAT